MRKKIDNKQIKINKENTCSNSQKLSPRAEATLDGFFVTNTSSSESDSMTARFFLLTGPLRVFDLGSGSEALLLDD